MNVKYGGRVPSMHSTKIEEGCIGSFGHSTRLAYGSEQSMTFLPTDEGPFYLSKEERQVKKFDHRTGEKIKQKQQKAELIALLKARNVDVLATYLSSKEI